MKRSSLSSPAVLLTGVLLLLTLPLLVRREIPNYTWDETNYHVPAVRQIAVKWPDLDLVADSLSATAPGYHYVLASVGQLTGTSLPALRLLNFAISAMLLIVLGTSWLRWGGASRIATAAILPLAACNFFVKSAACVVTDNPALLCVAGALMVALRPGSARAPASFALWSGAATAVRQSNVWLAGVGAVAAFVGPGSLARRIALGIAALAPCAVLALLWSRWHGPVPAVWAGATLARPDANAVAPLVYLLALAAFFAPPYLLAAGAGSSADVRRWAAVGAAAGFVLSLVGPTNFDADAGRWGGYLWEVSRHFPHVARRSLFFALFCPLGGAALALLARRLIAACNARRAAVWIGGFLSWAATLAANQQAFHRYVEPTLLLFLICWLLLTTSIPPAPPARPRALWALGVAQIVLTLATAHARTYGWL